MACLLKRLWQNGMDEASRRLVTGWLSVLTTACHGPRNGGKDVFMEQENPKQNALGGGIFIAIGLLGGGIIGVFMGEPSIGMVAGLATGIAVAGLVWIIDRKRHN
jgi:uncharacterized protein YcfJ